MSEEFTYEYLPWRGITRETFKFYNIKTKVDTHGIPISIGYPNKGGGYKIRNRSTKQFYSEGNIEPGLFGVSLFPAGGHKNVTVTEGELDALSLYQVLRTPCVSVQSASSAQRDCAVDYEFLNSFERIYLAFDNDAAGREAVGRVAKLFDYNKVFVVKFTNRKDANDYLQHGETDDLRNLWHNAKRYLPEQVVSSFAEFEKVLNQPNKEGISYPFPTLTKMTYGIRTGECVLLKAPEKVGKSTLMHTILHHILKETDDNVAGLFIEEDKRRTLQAIGGIELRRPAHLPDSGVTGHQIMAAVQKVVGRDDRLHLYSHFGTDDPDVLLDTIRFLVSARSCKYVILDHVTMAVTGLAGDSERRALEYLATRLEMMVKELDFALLMVSHVNDVGQTRGSHYLTKLADITISAERDTMATDDKDKRTISLSIPFNRFSANSGYCCGVVFDPETYTLAEDVEQWVTSPSSVPDIIDMTQLTPVSSGLELREGNDTSEQKAEVLAF